MGQVQSSRHNRCDMVTYIQIGIDLYTNTYTVCSNQHDLNEKIK